MGWRLIKIENCDNENYKRHTQLNLILLFNEIYSFTSNFDFEQSIDWIHKNKIVVATVWKADQKHFVILQKETGKCNDFRNNKKKDWFSHKTGVVFVYGEVCKGTSKNSATFKMELSTTISNGRKLQRALPDGLTTNCLLKFVKHLTCQTHPDARFYKKSCLISI